ncbi:hypothetical protein G6F31_018106 [Rhizopus arrhizus]|nr:hypothetical protein G6F31_018106 [Rhizopus arrhizus]
MVAVEVPEELGIGDEGPGPAEFSESLQAGRQLGAALERLRLRSGRDRAGHRAGARYHQEPPVPRAADPEAGADAARHRRRTAVSQSTDPRDADERALAQALREQEQRHAVPDVSEALQQRLHAETHDSGVLYVVVQVLLFGALLAAAAWYFWL